MANKWDPGKHQRWLFGVERWNRPSVEIYEDDDKEGRDGISNGRLLELGDGSSDDSTLTDGSIGSAHQEGICRGQGRVESRLNGGHGC